MRARPTVDCNITRSDLDLHAADPHALMGRPIARVCTRSPAGMRNARHARPTEVRPRIPHTHAHAIHTGPAQGQYDDTRTRARVCTQACARAGAYACRTCIAVHHKRRSSHWRQRRSKRDVHAALVWLIAPHRARHRVHDVTVPFGRGRKRPPKAASTSTAVGKKHSGSLKMPAL